MRVRGLLLIGVLLAACGSDPATGGAGGMGGGGSGGAGGAPFAPTEPWGAGSRLALVGHDLDGATYATGFFDTALGEPCAIDLAVDGVYRCLPGRSSTEFADSNCSEPAFEVDPGCGVPAPAYVLRDEPHASCQPTRTRVFLLGAALPGKSVFLADSSSCFGPLPVAGTLHALGAEVPPESFVAFEEVEVVRTPELSARYRRGEDGSYWLLGPQDRTVGDACVPAEVDGVLRCVPWRAEDLTEFTDATCSTPASAACVPAASAQIVEPITACPTGSFVELGAEQVGPPYVADASACSPGSCSACAVQPIVGPRSSQSLPTCERASAGAGRVRLETVVAGGGAIARPSLRDTERDVTCRPASTKAGLRCAPFVYYQLDTLLFFEDPACKEALLPLHGFTCPPEGAVAGRSASCGADYDWEGFFALEERWTSPAPVYWRELDDVTCSEAFPLPDAWPPYHRIGKKVPFEALAPLEPPTFL